MKERPILFSGPMVQAILGGRKTMTRRVIKFPYIEIRDDGILASEYHDPGTERPSGLCHKVTCPYGQPGDKLWVRETWMPFTEQGCPVGATIYRATDHPEPDGDSPLRWNPPIFMPKSASRITLEITAVRVERVQDISEMDTYAEGRSLNETMDPVTRPGAAWFRALWDSLNAKRGYGWDANPWVWVLSFKRVKGAE